jgi:hypothetical protein
MVDDGERSGVYSILLADSISPTGTVTLNHENPDS